MTYKEFIDNILQTRGRFNCGDKYHERHHILAKCCGGTNDTENLIDLYPREHYIAHRLLAIENPDNEGLVCAYTFMVFGNGKDKNKEKFILTPEEYEEARIKLSHMMKERFKDKTRHPNWGKKLSEETKRKISVGHKGLRSSLGRVLSDETKKKIGEANHQKGEETRKKQSASQKKRGHYAGSNNPKARKTIRLSDGKIYDYGKQAAEENQIDYGLFKQHIKKHIGDFMYYDEWLELQKTEK